MIEYEKVSDDVKELFEEVVAGMNVPNVDIEILVNDKQKEIYKICKMSDLVTKLTDGLVFAIVLNENVFDRLPEDMQRIALTECITGISQAESGAISLEKPDFNTHTGVLQKFGHEAVIQLKESIKSLYEQKKKEEDELKAATKAKGKKKKAFQ